MRSKRPRASVLTCLVLFFACLQVWHRRVVRHLGVRGHGERPHKLVRRAEDNVIARQGFLERTMT